jgi:hypothetical protein
MGMLRRIESSQQRMTRGVFSSVSSHLLNTVLLASRIFQTIFSEFAGLKKSTPSQSPNEQYFVVLDDGKVEAAIIRCSGFLAD